MALLALCGAGLVANVFYHSPNPGQLTSSQTQDRRAEVANADQQRQARTAKQRSQLAELKKQAEQLSIDLNSKSAALNPADSNAVIAVQDSTIQYNNLLQQIRILQTALENIYYATLVPANSARRTPAEKAALPYRDEDLLETESETVAAKNRLSDTTESLLAGRKFAELDVLAAKLRTSRAECANGTWHLRNFYDGFAELPDYLPESAWTDRIAAFQAWIAEYPKSITPRVALASLWCEWAWRASGGDYADSVSQRNWQLFRERLGQAAKVLADAGQLDEKCPVWWDLTQRLALAQQWNRERYDALFEDAVRFDPHYTAFYANKNVYLLPRWYGKPGECSAFEQASADHLGGEEGDILYARLLWRFHGMDLFDTNCIVKEAGVSWPRIRNGFEAILRRYPNSFEAASELCYLCGQQGERDRMRALFARIGPFVDTNVYGSSRRFLQDRRLAFQP